MKEEVQEEEGVVVREERCYWHLNRESGASKRREWEGEVEEMGGNGVS